MSSSFGGFPFPIVPGATAVGGPGFMFPHPTTMMSADAGTGTGTTRGSNDRGKKKQQQDRRERAKLHARKCREKKKNELENLQEEEKLLREENLRLRALVRSKMPDQAQHIVSECCYSSERVRHLNPYIYQQAVGDGEGATSSSPAAAPSSPPAQLGRNDFDLIESLSAGKQSFVLTDPRLPDNPIVYCSDSFCELTGYSRNEIIGRNCRFLQTTETDPRAVETVRKAIESGSDCTTVLLNAKSDGTTFWNRFFVAPLRDRRGRVVNYVSCLQVVDSLKHFASYSAMMRISILS
jgi:PAS domain S-box-containing protein